jgi:hypothetical protein
MPRRLALPEEERSDNHNETWKWKGEDFIAALACVLGVAIYIINGELLERTDFFPHGDMPCLGFVHQPPSDRPTR